jgi:hypothetical protein
MTIQPSCDQKCIGFALVLAAPMLAAGLHWRLESDSSCFRFKRKMKNQKFSMAPWEPKIFRVKKGVIRAFLMLIKRGKLFFTSNLKFAERKTKPRAAGANYAQNDLFFRRRRALCGVVHALGAPKPSYYIKKSHGLDSYNVDTGGSQALIEDK